MLICERHEYPFSTALSIGNLDVAGFTASGTVHDLNRAEDFNGSGVRESDLTKL